MLSQGGGFDKLLLDSLYEDENARRQLQLRNAGYGYGGMDTYSPFDYQNQQDPFAMSNNIAPPSNMQMAFMSQQQQQHQMMFQQQQQQQMMFQQSQQTMFQQPQQYNMMTVPYQYSQTQYPQQMHVMDSSNPFDDPLPVPSYPYNSMHQQGNYHLM